MPCYEIILPGRFYGFNNSVDHIAGQLWSKYPEIIGENNKQYPKKKMPAVSPEIFIEC
jgi:hypothetical protein